MTIDLCTRIWNGRDPWGDHGAAHGHRRSDGAAAEATLASHEAAMNCVDVAAVVGYASTRLGITLGDEPVLQAIAEHADRRVGILGVDATGRDVLARVDDAAETEGVIGIALAPADQGLRPTDDRFVDVLRAASERGLVVLIQNPGMFHPDSDLAFADPRLIDELLREHRDDADVQAAKIVLGDLGCVPIEHTLAVVAKHRNVFVEISAAASRPGRLRSAIYAAFEFGVASRVLFASGFPRETPERAIERLYSVNAESTSGERVPREVLRQIVEGDALGKLGIRHIWAGSGKSSDGSVRAGFRESGTVRMLAGSDADEREDSEW